MLIDAIDKFMHLVPGCPRFEAVDALRYALIEFCDRSHSLVHWVETTSDMMSFNTVESKMQINALFDVSVDGKRVPACYMNSDWIDEANSENPVLVHGGDMNATMAILPAPTQAAQVRLLVSMSPTPDAQDLPDWLWTRHRECLKFGMLARLMADPGATYASDSKAMFYRESFDEHVSRASAAISANTSSRASRLRVTPAGGAVLRTADRLSTSAIQAQEVHAIFWDASAFWTPTNYWM